jgi:hypothetical protein
MSKSSNDPLLLNPGIIEWATDVVEFDYGTFVIRTDGKEWVAEHQDEERFPEMPIIHSPEDGIYYVEDIVLFGERTLTVDEFQLLQEQLTKI